MKVIEVLGSGCPNCQKLEANAREAVAQTGVDAEIRHVTDFAEIASRGVMNTPGLVIDGKVRSTGKIPPPWTIAAWLTAEA
jgi:small redox-active disulfide protein 2